MSHDTIADMLTQIRNAVAVQTNFIIISKNRINWEIARILYNEGYINYYQKFEYPYKSSLSNFLIGLKYNSKSNKNRESVITVIKRISKPGLRVYTKNNELSPILGKLGISIISTPKGLMTNIQAKKSKLGGEVLFYFW